MSDGRVIDIPFLARFALVNFIIAPFRAPKSAKEYQKLWTEKGSPLMFHGKELLEKVRQKLGNNFEVELAMRYQEPSVEQTLQNLLDKNISELIVFPLFLNISLGSRMSSRFSLIPIILRSTKRV